MHLSRSRNRGTAWRNQSSTSRFRKPKFQTQLSLQPFWKLGDLLLEHHDCLHFPPETHTKWLVHIITSDRWFWLLSTALYSHRAGVGMHGLACHRRAYFSGWVCVAGGMWCATCLSPVVTGNREYFPHRVGMINIFKNWTQCLALSRHSVCAVSCYLFIIFSLVRGYSSQ